MDQTANRQTDRRAEGRRTRRIAIPFVIALALVLLLAFFGIRSMQKWLSPARTNAAGSATHLR
jgi:Tfp pilus assembly protein PilX